MSPCGHGKTHSDKVARRSWGPLAAAKAAVEGGEDPWLCVPGFRQVCYSLPICKLSIDGVAIYASPISEGGGGLGYSLIYQIIRQHTYAPCDLLGSHAALG